VKSTSKALIANRHTTLPFNILWIDGGQRLSDGSANFLRKNALGR
jgi:hypothetical protein